MNRFRERNFFFFFFGVEELNAMFDLAGGKAKPLKQPKADKKEYDEVFSLLVLILIFYKFLGLV